ncbi:hypothetical protein QCA50_014082 [Cerrena zonata]|uniref:Uncharacterized protein n=1 Tax=Cerrena zonata TaxID=2478898 RepID=A0AAW0FUH8_9APHY
MRNTIPEQYITSFGLSGTADYDYNYRPVDIPQAPQNPLILSPDDAPDFDRFQHILADRMAPIVEVPVQQIGSLPVSIASTPSLEEESSVEGGDIDEGSTSRFRKFRERTSKFIKAVRRRFRAARERLRL